jgi:transmembrane protein TMEM220
MRLFQRAFGALGALLFGAFASLQLNDPDALEWIAIYGLASVLCLAAALGRRTWPYGVMIPGVALLWALSLLPAILAQPVVWHAVFGPGGMTYAPGVEETREALGLVIVAVWTLPILLVSRRLCAPSS